MTTPRCALCGHDPKNRHNRVYECSHVDCPHRPRAWATGTDDHIYDWNKRYPDAARRDDADQAPADEVIR